MVVVEAVHPTAGLLNHLPQCFDGVVPLLFSQMGAGAGAARAAGSGSSTRTVADKSPGVV